MSTLKLALAQLNFLVGDIDGNAEKILNAIDQARAGGADLIAFPELALTGYPPEDLLLRLDFLNSSLLALHKIAEASTDITVVLGHPQLTEQGLMNAASVLQDGKILLTYYKQCLPNYGVFDERRYFVKGDNQAAIFSLKNLKIGLIICEDTWFPEPTRQAKAQGAELLLSINASPFEITKKQARENTLRQRQQESDLPIVYLNCVGAQDELMFDGASAVFDKYGHVVAQAPFFIEELLTVNVELTTPLQFNMQPVLSSPLLSGTALTYQALVLAVRDYVEKNHFPGVLLGLSGGIDSALTLAIAVDAVGAARVQAVLLPSRHTSELSIREAKAQAELLQVKYSEINIEPAFNAFLSSLSDEFTGLAVDTTEENLQSRCRGVILMALSNKTGKLVLTTGNKSELATGYTTLYGDMAGGYGVLKDVLKTQVFELAHYRNSINLAIPTAVIERVPSAELAPNQCDQDTLPPYPMLDEIIVRYVERQESMTEIIAAGFDETIVQKVVKLILNNEHKRRQAAPGIKISPRAFGRERRYPITSGFRG